MHTHIRIAATHFMLSMLWFSIIITDVSRPVNDLLGDAICSVISVALMAPFTIFVMPFVYDTGRSVEMQILVHLIVVAVAMCNAWFVGGILNLIWRAISDHLKHKEAARVALKNRPNKAEHPTVNRS